MPNPISQALGRNQVTNNLNQVKQMMNMIRSAGNPQMMVQNMLSQNPQVSNLINQYGGDPQRAFYALCEQKGVNPQEFIKALKNG